MKRLPELPLPDGWGVVSMNSRQTDQFFTNASLYHGEDPPLLRNLVRTQAIRVNPYYNERPRMRGWKMPGPGPKVGRLRVPSIHDLEEPFLLGMIHLTREAISFQQTYTFQSSVSENEGIHFSTSMIALTELENSLSISKAMRRCIWTITHQLGVPAFLVKLRSPFHAISLHFLPDRPGNQWYCSHCTNQEVSARADCIHAFLLGQCLEKFSNCLNCSSDFVLCSMTQSSAFNHISDLTSTCFYGAAKKLEFAVVRSEQYNFLAPVTSRTRLQIVRCASNNKHWSCLMRSCAGTGPSCSHRRTVQDHIARGLTHCFPSIHDFVNEQDRHASLSRCNVNTEPSHIPIPQHSRPLIPTETAFKVDFDVNRNSRNNTSILLKASSTCHCGSTMNDERSSTISNCILRVEAGRCYVNYRQELWTCPNGHCVTPEEYHETREGLLWVSKNTAFTEVFLFDLLLHMTLGGGTISGQSDLRSQLLFLQTHHMSREDTPRSSQCIRKALIMYSMAVVKAIPNWVFRCHSCATESNGAIHYEKLSFDGQQLGFNIRKDVRYDFYGKPATPWRRPVDRCTEAASLAFIIQSRNLRAIVTESLRVREVSSGYNSVQSLCRSMVKISLRTKDAIRAAVAAIKLFDTTWSVFLPIGVPKCDDSTFEAFSTSANSDLFAHPFQFICEMKDSSDFTRCVHIKSFFRDVLDCSRAAAALCILLNDLRNDLKAHIPEHDRIFISRYTAWANQRLHTWLAILSQSSQWVPSHSVNEQIHDGENPSGIGEHATFLEHPFRPPFSWKRVMQPMQLQYDGESLCRLHTIHDLVPPKDARTAVLLFAMALLTENVTVWIREGNLSEVMAGVETLKNAEMYAGQRDSFVRYRATLQQVHNISLLYEGIMSLLGANTEYARPMFKVMRSMLEMIQDRYNAYSSCISEFSSAKSFICSPKEFDEMLIWTGAVGPELSEFNKNSATTHETNMRHLYAKMASSKSNDFLETGIWGPDFPIRRPSPSSVISDNIPEMDMSCSKDFNIHNAFSPGTFGGYCLCRHAKTVIVSFLKRPEGCRMPLNIIVERCAKLPKYVVYDFACGTQTSVLGLSAEISKHVRFVIDPFHFPGHKKCSLAMHQANYSELRGSNVESQEQRNSRIKVMEKTLRASRDIHFMHFIILGHAYLNLKAMYLDHKDGIGEDIPSEEDWGSRAWLRWIRDNMFETHA